MQWTLESASKRCRDAGVGRDQHGRLVIPRIYPGGPYGVGLGTWGAIDYLCTYHQMEWTKA